MCRRESRAMPLPTAPALFDYLIETLNGCGKTLNGRETLKAMHSNAERRAPKY